MKQLVLSTILNTVLYSKVFDNINPLRQKSVSLAKILHYGVRSPLLGRCAYCRRSNQRKILVSVPLISIIKFSNTFTSPVNCKTMKKKPSSLPCACKECGEDIAPEKL